MAHKYLRPAYKLTIEFDCSDEAYPPRFSFDLTHARQAIAKAVEMSLTYESRIARAWVTTYVFRNISERENEFANELFYALQPTVLVGLPKYKTRVKPVIGDLP